LKQSFPELDDWMLVGTGKLRPAVAHKRLFHLAGMRTEIQRDAVIINFIRPARNFLNGVLIVWAAGDIQAGSEQTARVSAIQARLAV
jgi:hypothetical protein